MNGITDIIQKATGARRYEAEQNILISASKIIRDCDDDALRAIIRSTNADGDLWGAIAMAEAEIIHRATADRKGGAA